MLLLVFHELAAVGDCCTFVEQWMAEVDCTPNPLRVLGQRVPGSWTVCSGGMRSVLVVLGLYHMHVRCVIPKELGGDYKHKVRVLA